MVFTMTATNTQNRMIGTANKRMVCGMNGRLGLRHGVLGARVGHADFTRQKVCALRPIGAFLVPNHPVHGDTAADLIAVALRHDAGAHRRAGSSISWSTTAAARIDSVGVGVRVEVVDRGGGPCRAETPS